MTKPLFSADKLNTCLQTMLLHMSLALSILHNINCLMSRSIGCQLDASNEGTDVLRNKTLHYLRSIQTAKSQKNSHSITGYTLN